MTLDIARLVANVNHRAQRLFEDGYTAVWIEEGYTLGVTNDEGTTYEVDVLFETCSCPFWKAHQGKHSCKHLLGWQRLLERQAEHGIAVLLGLVESLAGPQRSPCGQTGAMKREVAP